MIVFLLMSFSVINLDFLYAVLISIGRVTFGHPVIAPVRPVMEDWLDKRHGTLSCRRYAQYWYKVV